MGDWNDTIPTIASGQEAPGSSFATLAAVLTAVSGPFSTHTPTLNAQITTPTLGSGSVRIGRYQRIGKLLFYYGRIGFGTSGTNAGSGQYWIDLPPDMYAAISYVPLGAGIVYDAGTGIHHLCVPRVDDPWALHLVRHGDTTPVGAATLTWSASDIIDWFAVIELQ